MRSLGSRPVGRSSMSRVWYSDTAARSTSRSRSSHPRRLPPRPLSPRNLRGDAPISRSAPRPPSGGLSGGLGPGLPYVCQERLARGRSPAPRPPGKVHLRDHLRRRVISMTSAEPPDPRPSGRGPSYGDFTSCCALSSGSVRSGRRRGREKLRGCRMAQLRDHPADPALPADGGTCRGRSRGRPRTCPCLRALGPVVKTSGAAKGWRCPYQLILTVLAVTRAAEGRSGRA